MASVFFIFFFISSLIIHSSNALAISQEKFKDEPIYHRYYYDYQVTGTDENMI